MAKPTGRRPGRPKGTPLSEAHKQAISRSMKGKPKTMEHMEAMVRGHARRRDQQPL